MTTEMKILSLEDVAEHAELIRRALKKSVSGFTMAACG